MVEAAAVVCEVRRCGNNWGRVVLLRGVVVGCVKDVVEDVLLHLPDLGVTIDPSLVSVVRHCVELGASRTVSYMTMISAQVQLSLDGNLPIP